MSYLPRRKSKPVNRPKCIETAYTVSNLPSLRRKRTIAYNRISKALEIGNLALTSNHETQIALFLSYCQELRNIADSFQDSHFTILDLLSDNVDDSENDIQERFDEAYFQVVAMQRRFQPDSSQQTETSRPNSAIGSHNSGNTGNMRLPKITLPTFSGTIKEWPEFIATYNALIHESTVLSEIEKFHYLVSVLRGDALSLIRTFPVACEHYLSAYEALKSRYEDKRELAFTCWRDILDVNFKTTNAQDFRHTLDTIDENLTILKQLKLPTEHWDFVLCYNILSKLDTKLRREFEEKHTEVELPQYKQIRAYLHSKCEALIRDTHFTAAPNKNASTSKEASGASQKPKRHNVLHSLVAPTVNAPVTNSDKQGVKPTKVATTTKPVRKCSFCDKEHHISACQAFLAKTVDERMAITAEKRWCYNCLNASHSVRQCTSIFSCQKCKRKHHTLLHRDQESNKPASSTEQSNSVSLFVKESSSSSHAPANSTVLLATALIQIRDASGEFHTFRALFDTGSQNNLLTSQAAQRLNLKPNAASANVHGLGGTPASVTGQVTCEVGANRNVKYRLEMFVIPSICGDQPIARLNTSGWDEVKTLPLADPGFDIPGPIDVLLGADVFAESLLEQRLTGNASQPRAFNSVFGWLLLGKTRLASSTLLLGVPSPNVDDSLNAIVQRFWEIDTVPQSTRLTPDEQLCENSFNSDHYRDETGRHVVSLPFKDNAEPVYEDSREKRRYHAIDRRLSRDPTRNLLACQTIQELANDEGPNYPQAKTVLTSDTIDHIDTGSSPLEDARESKSQVNSLFALGSFELRKNRPELLSDLTSEACLSEAITEPTFTEAEDTTLKVLGLEWKPASDSFVFNVQPINLPCIKRTILSEVARIFNRPDFMSILTFFTLPRLCSRWVKLVANRARELLSNSQWWAGPQWLAQEQSEWPTDISKHRSNDNVVPSEQRRIVLVTDNQTDQTSVIDQLFERFSSLDKICRILAYVRRFCNHARDTDSRPNDVFITNIERHRALLTIVKHFQDRHFPDVISTLKLRKQLPRSLRKLDPFLDNQSILRVGGRLARSGLEFEHKHPALLPRKCLLTTSVIESTHRNNFHPGLNTTHYLILQQFWILAAKRAIRHQLSKCIRCYRLHPQPLQPFMSDLPTFRVNQAKPFSEVGVDFGGPFRIKLGSHRGAKIDKAYLCLFVCLSTKAVHLEVVSTLSTDGFIAALRRFVSRRGRCNVIHSDCGTNFVGASSQLASCIEQASHSERIAFKRNPPSAPHFGGIWEIQIKAAKCHLYRIVGDQTLTFEELTTLFTQIESILNSRPLCPLSSDPNDLNVLTPGHFLTLEPLTAVPDSNFTNIKINRLNRWQLIQSFQQHFWQRWKNEYLHALTQRAKWTKDAIPLTVNSIVLIKDDNRPPLHWPLARVVSLHPGPDGVVRVATVKTARDYLVKRPLVKLCPLPSE